VTATFKRSHFTWLAYLLLAFYGFLLNSLGPITPFLKRELGLSYSVSSLHFTAFAVGILLVGVVGHLVIERAGRRRSMWIGAGGMSVGALLLITGRVPACTIGAAFIMGLVGSLILIIVPSALAEEHGERVAVALAEANVVASSVATTAPLLVGWLASSAFGWRLGLGAAALAPPGLYLGFGRAQAPTRTVATNPVSTGPAGKRALPPLFWFYWVALIFSVSVEFCMISWCADFLVTSLHLPTARGSQMTSLFLGGMMLGRLAGSRLVQRMSVNRLVVGSILTAAGGFLLFWLARTPALVLGGLALAGLGVASLYPMILSQALGAAPGQTVQASARATLASGVAILASPLILGGFADAVGIQRAYAVVVVLLAGVFGMVLWARLRRRSASGTRSGSARSSS